MLLFCLLVVIRNIRFFVKFWFLFLLLNIFCLIIWMVFVVLDEVFFLKGILLIVDKILYLLLYLFKFYCLLLEDLYCMSFIWYFLLLMLNLLISDFVYFFMELNVFGVIFEFIIIIILYLELCRGVVVVVVVVVKM